MRIAKLSKIAGAAIIAGVIALTTAGWLMIDELKVGGPHYNRIILGKDLLADILPPPEYIIEPFLEATLALDDPAHYKLHKERMETLQKDYDTRHAYWLKQELPKDLAQVFLTESHAAAIQFWDLAQNEFFPALESGDIAKAKQVHEKLRAAYSAHREKIDATIVGSTTVVADIEQTTATRVSRSIWLTSLVALSVLAGIMAAVAAALRGVIAPITQAANAMRDLAAGNMAVTFPGGGRDDEIGDMAAAGDIFRDNAIARTALEHEQEEMLHQEHERRIHLEHVLEDFEARMEKIGRAHIAATTKSSAHERELETVAVAAAGSVAPAASGKPKQHQSRGSKSKV